MRARLGMRGELTAKVIRANPSWHQRFADALAALIRRLAR